jgi:hypothetical protein
MTAHPPLVTELLRNQPMVAPLGPGRPVLAQRTALEGLTATALGLPDSVDFRACQAALWLSYNFLAEAHAISQEIDTPEGSYWHAIVHRREPDADNAKYWFRRVGQHPIFRELANTASRLGYPSEPDWDPFAFVDACEAHRDKGDRMEQILVSVQEMEWHLLFGFCWSAV